MEDLIKEYRGTLSSVNAARTKLIIWKSETKKKNGKLVKVKRKIGVTNEDDYQNLGLAASDLRYSLDFMRTGRRPGCRRGVTRLAGTQREILCDPDSFEFIKLAAAYKKPVSELSQDQKNLLEDLLSVLAPRQRQAYELVKGAGWSYENAAKIMKVKKGTVENLVAQAEKKLHLIVRMPTNSERDFSVNNVQRVMFDEQNPIS